MLHHTFSGITVLPIENNLWHQCNKFYFGRFKVGLKQMY